MCGSQASPLQGGFIACLFWGGGGGETGSPLRCFGFANFLEGF